MAGILQWHQVFIGVFIALAEETLGVPVLPVAIGLYLPFELSAAIMLGGSIRFLADKKNGGAQTPGGILFCSGLIAGEGIVGILLAVITISGWSDVIDLSGIFSLNLAGSCVVLIASMLLIYFISIKK